MTDHRVQQDLLRVSRAPRQAIFDHRLPHAAFRFLCLIEALDTGPECMRVDPPGWVRLRPHMAAALMRFGHGPDAEQWIAIITQLLIDRGYIDYLPPRALDRVRKVRSLPPRYRVKFTAERPEMEVAR